MDRASGVQQNVGDLGRREAELSELEMVGPELDSLLVRLGPLSKVLEGRAAVLMEHQSERRPLPLVLRPVRSWPSVSRVFIPRFS